MLAMSLGFLSAGVLGAHVYDLLRQGIPGRTGPRR